MSNFNHLKLAGAIAESGKSQNEISTQLGVHYNTISAWATGKASPTPFKLFKLLQMVGYSDEQLRSQRLIDWYLMNSNHESTTKAGDPSDSIG